MLLLSDCEPSVSRSNICTISVSAQSNRGCLLEFDEVETIVEERQQPNGPTVGYWGPPVARISVTLSLTVRQP